MTNLPLGCNASASRVRGRFAPAGSHACPIAPRPLLPQPADAVTEASHAAGPPYSKQHGVAPATMGINKTCRLAHPAPCVATELPSDGRNTLPKLYPRCFWGIAAFFPWHISPPFRAGRSNAPNSQPTCLQEFRIPAPPLARCCIDRFSRRMCVTDASAFLPRGLLQPSPLLTLWTPLGTLRYSVMAY